jgi:hypothetical protein
VFLVLEWGRDGKSQFSLDQPSRENTEEQPSMEAAQFYPPAVSLALDLEEEESITSEQLL